MNAATSLAILLAELLERNELELAHSAPGQESSEVVRRAIRALAEVELPRRIAGLGKFESGIHDLGSNEAHLSGFGK